MDRILGPNNISRALTTSLLLCFQFKVIKIITGQELETILSKVEFYDPNERLLWNSATFRQASIEEQLKCIIFEVNGRMRDTERLAFTNNSRITILL